MIRTVAFWALLPPCTILFSLVAAAGGLVGAPEGLYDWVHRRWAGLMLAVAGAEVRADGLENLTPGRPAILACNHQSVLDIWALMAALPVSLRFVAKAELEGIPVFASGCRAAGHVFVDRGSPASARRSMDEAGKVMRRRGIALVIFPEGTRSPDGELLPFKTGAFRLARRTGAPVLPVAVDGGGRILGKGRRRLRPGTLRIRVGPELTPERTPVGGRSELAERAQARVGRMLEEMGRKG